MTNDYRRTANPESTSANQGPTWIIAAGVFVVACLCSSAIGALFVGKLYDQNYAGRIYLGVDVYGVELGGLTVDEAAAVLLAELANPDTLPLTLRDGQQVWSRSWSDVGLHLDPTATARLAYQVGRDGTPVQKRIAQVRAFVFGSPLSPIILLPDPAQATEALQALNAEIAVPPVNATLVIQPGGVTPVPGQAGRELDVEAIVAALPYTIGIGDEGVVMELLTRPVEPTIADPGPAQAHAEALLAQPFTLTTDDPLTDFSATWSVEPDVVAEWLVASESDENPGGAPLIVTVREQAVRAYLEEMGNQLTDEVAFDVEKTISSVRAAVEAGQSQTAVALVHQPHTYVVQPGDTLMLVAHRHGFPVWRLTEANPGVEPGTLWPGQQITIPSVDVLFPLPLVPDRRIVIDISEQHLYAYEGDTQVYSFIASTGIDSSPTIPGVFQILSKEEEAYASSWDLWMPHFMGIYRTGPDFTNGIHALPTLSSGARLWEGYLGRPVSYGCIVIGLSEAAALYEWADLGTLVVIQE
jgi:LysM repeat protein